MADSSEGVTIRLAGMVTPPTVTSCVVTRAISVIGGTEAQHLLDHRRDERDVGPKLRRDLRVLFQAQHGVAQQQGGRDVARHQQQGAELDDLAVGQALALHLGGHQAGDQVVAGVGAAVVDVLLEVGVHLLERLLDQPLVVLARVVAELHVHRVVDLHRQHPVRPAAEQRPVLGQHTQQLRDDDDGQRVGEVPHQVELVALDRVQQLAERARRCAAAARRRCAG
ncbi:hypothetical protein GCM10020000_75390 [Streptomyces olivoverticillatus]